MTTALLSAAPTHRTAPSAPGRLLPQDAREPRSAGLEAHLARQGALPDFGRRPERLIDQVEASGLLGRGGAAFPAAVKLRSVAAAPRPVVVANGTEGEPASTKDRVLLAHNPHLVIDGTLAAAAMIGAREAVIAISRGAGAAGARLDAALAERGSEARLIRVERVPERFVAGEERALVHWLNGGPAKPTFGARPFERGVRGRPTLVQNVETLANIALIARHGPDWFREAGTEDEPGTVLATLLGAVAHPGVVETAPGTLLGGIVARAGGPVGRPSALLLGGYFGAWLPAGALERPLTTAALGSLGARVLAVLPEGACGLTETARVVRWLAGQGAGQCGPCRFGLPAMAEALETLAYGPRQLTLRPNVNWPSEAAPALRRLEHLGGAVAGRGACAHPDGVVRLVQSALEVFAGEVSAHLDGRCSADAGAPILPIARNDDAWT